MRFRNHTEKQGHALYGGWTLLLCIWGATFILFHQLGVLYGSASETKKQVWREIEHRAQHEVRGFCCRDDSLCSMREDAGRMCVERLDMLVEAIILIESAGNPSVVGQAGERGLMQIKEDTWWAESQKAFGEALPFDFAFDPEINQHVGRRYILTLHAFLHGYRQEWNAGERGLLLASYNAGPGQVQGAAFDLNRLPSAVRDYVKRAEAIHDLLLAGEIEPVRQFATSRAPLSESYHSVPVF